MVSFQTLCANGIKYENDVGNELMQRGFLYNAQKRYKTTLGTYIADFVLHNGIIVEATLANLQKCLNHHFIQRKIKKLNELALTQRIVVITPFVDSWRTMLHENIQVLPDVSCIDDIT